MANGLWIVTGVAVIVMAGVAAWLLRRAERRRRDAAAALDARVARDRQAPVRARPDIARGLASSRPSGPPPGAVRAGRPTGGSRHRPDRDRDRDRAMPDERDAAPYVALDDERWRWGATAPADPGYADLQGPAGSDTWFTPGEPSRPGPAADITAPVDSSSSGPDPSPSADPSPSPAPDPSPPSGSPDTGGW